MRKPKFIDYYNDDIKEFILRFTEVTRIVKMVDDAYHTRPITVTNYANGETLKIPIIKIPNEDIFVSTLKEFDELAIILKCKICGGSFINDKEGFSYHMIRHYLEIRGKVKENEEI